MRRRYPSLFAYLWRRDRHFAGLVAFTIRRRRLIYLGHAARPFQAMAGALTRLVSR